MNRKCHLIIAVLLTFICAFHLNSQNPFNYFYRVTFRDKGPDRPENYTPEQLFSERAIARREREGVFQTDIKDVPVYAGYTSQVKKYGLILHCTSRWMNSALFKSAGPVNTEQVKALPFVSDVITVKQPAVKGSFTEKTEPLSDALEITGYDKPVRMMNGNLLHTAGFNGKGILIAVLDGGFTNADKINSLALLRKRSGIKGSKDFVAGSGSVYNYNTHGTAVLSVLAGQIPDRLEGSAPGADYLLLRTEDTYSEFPAEEDFWAAGAEYADSAGADIISTSLGYAVFDNPAMNYTFSELDGNTAFVTRAADIAASRGIIVAASAGNERTKDWLRILAPADGDSVIAVAAVDTLLKIASFSSAGPSADGRIKPDLAAMGVNVAVQVTPEKITRSSGTSFSCPLISGMIACLKQAQPEASQTEIKDVLIRSANRSANPDSLYGYGIPDMVKALTLLQDNHLVRPEKGSVAWPNPTSGLFEVTLTESPLRVVTEIYSSSGIFLARKIFNEFAGRTIRFDELENRGNGSYFIKITTDKHTFVEKVIKTGN